MSSLELVSVLKDAMGSQKAIDASAKKISEANGISDAKRKEAQEAVQAIADVKAATIALGKDIKQHNDDVVSHVENMNRRNSQIIAQQADIDNQVLSAKEAFEKHSSAIAVMQAKAEERHVVADGRESAVSKREKDAASSENKNAQDAAKNKLDKDKIDADRAYLDSELEKLEARKKKLAEV